LDDKTRFLWRQTIDNFFSNVLRELRYVALLSRCYSQNFGVELGAIDREILSHEGSCQDADQSLIICRQRLIRAERDEHHSAEVLPSWRYADN